MRLLSLLLLPLLVAGCGDSSLTVRGTLLPGSDATDVYVVGQPLRSRIEADSFVISGISGEAAELEFADEDDRLGRMRIERWRGPEVTLRGIWLEDGTAFATTLGDESVATVNGLRMAAEGELPRNVAVEAVVLAISGRGDALIVRPVQEQLPDLRVVLTPGTAVEQGDGSGWGFDLEFGDTVRVEGTAESGYVVATRLVVRPSEPLEEPVAAAGGGAAGTHPESRPAGEGDREEDEVEAEDRPEGPGSLERPGKGRGRGRGLQKGRD